MDNRSYYISLMARKVQIITIIQVRLQGIFSEDLGTRLVAYYVFSFNGGVIKLKVAQPLLMRTPHKWKDASF